VFALACHNFAAQSVTGIEPNRSFLIHGKFRLTDACEIDKCRARSLDGPGAAASRRFKMTGMLRKVAISTVAALTLGAGVTATATPSAAQGWHGPGWHGGGWHGAYWRGGYWGGGWGGPVAAGVLGGLALGALAGTAYAYGPGYYGGCYVQNQAAYDGWGNFVGYQPVQVCY
jgi:hypothetical protein